jgi:rhodanese-related sulfurtransferase
MPKYYTTPRTLPLMDEEGNRNFIKINQKEGMNMFFDANALNVVVKAGASFQVQKSRTIMMVKEMMGMSPLFAQFIAEKGLNFVLDNMEGKGVEQLKQMVDGWLQEMQQQKQMAQQAQQQEMQNNPVLIKAKTEQMKIAQDAQKSQTQFQIDLAKMKQNQTQIIANLMQSRELNQIQLVKSQTERFVHSMDMALKHKDQSHRHAKEVIETHHKVTQPQRHAREA